MSDVFGFKLMYVVGVMSILEMVLNMSVKYNYPIVGLVLTLLLIPGYIMTFKSVEIKEK